MIVGAMQFYLKNCHSPPFLISSYMENGEHMFSEPEERNLKYITELYGKVKELIIFCEENQEEFKTNLHIVKELRDAFDHLMRVFAVKLELKEGREDGYIQTSLDKVLGHVFRAGYDTLDFATIILRDKINKEVSDFSPSAIQASIPNYYSEIRPSVESITTDIIKLRNNKDIAQPSPELFNEYFKNVIKLQEMFKQIVTAKPSLIEYANKERNGKWSNFSIQIVVGIIIGAILVWAGLSG